MLNNQNEKISVDLSHDEIVGLIRNCNLPYSLINTFSSLGIGCYWGGLADRWEWKSKEDPSWKKYSTEQLYKFYKDLRNIEKNKMIL